MSNITISRYAPDEAKDLRTGKGFSAYVEGAADTGERWILWLDDLGRPAVYYANREPSGAVLGEPVVLVPGSVVEI